jgi:hypothetical protein
MPYIGLTRKSRQLRDTTGLTKTQSAGPGAFRDTFELL